MPSENCFFCQECGRCPGCGGSDIDIGPPRNESKGATL